jgi:glycosyltransferase involved in cell wall biosynthesis
MQRLSAYASIVVPVYNRAELLRRCLTSLVAQTYPCTCFEIIVVDDGSTEDIATAAQEATEGWQGRFGLLRKANGGPASARNAGIRAAKGDIIAFTDSDCVADQDWLAGLIEELAKDGASGVGGSISNITPPGWIARYLTCSNFYRHRVRHGEVDYLVTANVAFRRSALLQAGGFNEQPGVWGEDADLSFRLIQSGHRLLLAPQARVKHYGVPNSLNGWANELFRYGRGNAILSRNWVNRRSVLTEFVRHGGALLLAPVLALKHWRCAGVRWAISFYPLIILEHAAFLLGLTRGVAIRRKQASGSNLIP